MKKSIMISLILIVCIFCVIAVPLFLERGGGEINFTATITQVKDGTAYAAVTEEHGYLGIGKLPGNIMFSTACLDEELEAGDKISGSYLRGTIEGQTVRVVSVTVITD